MSTVTAHATTGRERTPLAARRRAPLAMVARVVCGFACAGCAGTPKLALDTTVVGGSEVRWLAGDSLLAVALLGRGVAIVDAATGGERAAWRLPTLPSHAAHGLATSAGGETLAFATDDSVHVVRARDGVETMAVPGGGVALALSGDGHLLAWGDGMYGRVLDAGTGRVLGQGEMHAGRNGLAWSAARGGFAWIDGRRVFFVDPHRVPGPRADSSHADSTIGGVTGDLGPFLEAAPTQLAFSGSGRTLAVAESTSFVSYWDTRERRRLWRLELPGSEQFDRMALSADTWYLATAREGRARIRWSYTGRKLADWSPHEGSMVRDLAFSNDGRRLATVGADGHVRVWLVPPPRRERR
ncbi:MAG TPA: WD40 repeat domain-containing protein [Candidatus Eisenbacteria bacterium]